MTETATPLTLTHPEALYLRESAWSLWRAAEKARAENEQFHPSRNYSPLGTGHYACALIEDGRMHLYLKHKTGEEKLAQSAPGVCADFLGEHMGDVTVTIRPGYVHYHASSPTIPNSLLGTDAGVRPDTADHASTPYYARGAPRDRRADRGVRGGAGGR